MSARAWTIKELLQVTTEYLEKKDIDNPRLSAEILLAHQLNTNRVKLYLNFDQPLDDTEIAGYRPLIKRRADREPIQYITGIQEFWSLDFVVGPQVLIPRPESELLVERVISLCKEERLPENLNPNILDLGTGCGALAVALARELEEASIWACDISRDGLEVAKLNARKHGVQTRIEFRLGDLWQPFMDQELMFDVILSNPPYIASETIDSLPSEVREQEPRLAFDGREEGMFFIRKIITEGPEFLKPGGWILVEMDPEQTSKALNLVEKSNNYENKDRIKDYGQKYRVLVAQSTPAAKP